MSELLRLYDVLAVHNSVQHCFHSCMLTVKQRILCCNIIVFVVIVIAVVAVGVPMAQGVRVNVWANERCAAAECSSFSAALCTVANGVSGNGLKNKLHGVKCAGSAVQLVHNGIDVGMRKLMRPFLSFISQCTIYIVYMRVKYKHRSTRLFNDIRIL